MAEIAVVVHSICEATNTWNSRLPILLASPNHSTVNRRFSLLRILALAWIALGMSVPASAWAVHSSVHSVAQVGMDDHHHHEDDGGISVHEHEDDEAPDGGHDHMPSILLGAVTVPQAGVSLTEPIVIRQIYTMPQSRGVERHASDGLRRPPKLG